MFVALSLAGLLSAAPALAQRPVPSQLPPAAVSAALTLATEAAQAQAQRQAEVQAEPGSLDPRLRLAPCERVEPYLPAGVPAWGRTRVGLRCTSGPVFWRVFLPVDVHVWGDGVVAKVVLPAGARLTAGELRIAKVDWAADGGAFGDSAQLEGRTLSRPLVAGQALRPGDVQPQKWFEIGETVRVVVSGQGFVVSTEGQALARGLDGHLVRVRTEGGRVVVGRAVGDHAVEVSL